MHSLDQEPEVSCRLAPFYPLVNASCTGSLLLRLCVDACGGDHHFYRVQKCAWMHFKPVAYA